MKICVSGWYFVDPEKRVPQEEIDAFYSLMREVHKKYPVFIASHFKSDFLDKLGLPCVVTWVGGLEYLSYDYYLRNVWDQKSNVLFMHDDERIAGPEVFDQIAVLGEKNVDQAYLFEDEAEGIANGRQHGRGIWCSQKFLFFLLSYYCTCKLAEDHYDTHNPDALLPGIGPHNGIWYDRYNRGEHTAGKPPKGVQWYNTGIYHFNHTVDEGNRRGMKCRVQWYVPGFVSGRRAQYGCYERTRKMLQEKKRQENGIVNK